MTAADPARIAALLPESGDALLVTRQDLALASALASARPGLRWTVLSKADTAGRGGRWLLGRLRARRWAAAVIEDGAAEGIRRIDLYRALLLATPARRRVLALADRVEAVAWSRHALPLIGSGVAELVATTAALLGAVLDLALLRPRPRRPIPDIRRFVYLRTDFWFGVKAGGSVSHIAGFLGGARSLGMEPSVATSDPLVGLPPDVEQIVVPPASRPRLVEEAAIAAFNGRFSDRGFRALAARPPDAVVHRHSVFSLAGARLARRLGRPLILEVNSSEVWVRKTWSRLHFSGLARALELRAFRLADRITVVSEVLRDQLVAMGVDAGKIVVNPNGVDVARFDPASRGAAARGRYGFPDDAIVVGFLGTFTRWHGVLFLAEQVAPLVAAEPRLRFLFLGDGDLRAAVERRVAADGAAGACAFSGLLGHDRIPEHLAACDILVSPHLPFEDGSPFFGSPTKLFEYLAAGRAIVASRLGQIGDLLTDGKDALLHEPADADGFRRAMLTAAADPALRARLGAAARRTVETRYTWTENARRALGADGARA